MRRLLLCLLVVAGCAGSGTVAYHGHYNASVYSPDLVYVGPGVQVIADYDEPIFYSDSYYWRFYGGRWYRSHSYTGGWIYATPPYAVARIDRPYAYIRYRPQGYVSRRTYRDQRPVYRDHRTYREYESRPVYRDQRPVYRDQRSAPPPHTNVRPAPVQPRHPATPARPRPVPNDRDNAGPDQRDHRDHRDQPRVRDHRR